jgi:hypothetical protein
MYKTVVALQKRGVVKIKYMKDVIIKYKKPIIITIGITALNLYFGFDARFTIINLLWLLV